MAGSTEVSSVINMDYSDSSSESPPEAEENEEEGSFVDIEEVTINYDKAWWRIPHLLKLNAAIFFITLTSTTVGYDGSMLNGLQSLESWKIAMGRPKGAILGLLSNGGIFGSIAGAVVASWINDRWGRRWGILIGEGFAILGAILQGVSGSYGFFLGARIVLGLGGTIAGVGSPSLISEIAYPTHRSVCTSMYNVAWYLGAIVAAVVTYGTRNITTHYSWKIPSYLQGLLPLIQILFIWIIPESPRYLISRGKVEEARAVLRKCHIGGDTSEKGNTMIDFEVMEIETAIELEKIQNKSRYIDFLRTSGNRKRIFIVCWMAVMMQMSGNGLVSYYLNLVLDSIGITETTQQLKINVALMSYNFAISIAAACLTYRFKRRHMFLLSTSLMLLCYILWTILSAINQQRHFEDEKLGQGVIAMIFFYYFSYDIGMNGLPFLYMTEVLSYSLRAKGLNIFGIGGLITGVYNGFVNPVAMDAIEWKYYIVFCCILACEVPVVYFFFPETFGYSLEEVTALFGDDPHEFENTISAIRSGKGVSSHVEYVEEV